MDKTNKTILVTGAAGQQGGATARHLLKDGWKISALVRDENKEAAQDLKKLGAELVKGDMADPSSLDKAMKDVYGVFSIQNFWQHGYEGELDHGKKLADAAKKANVKHYLQSSVGGAERSTKIPHFDVKYEIESYIKKLGLPCTFMRPVFFMENFNNFSKPTVSGDEIIVNLPIKKDTPLQMIAVDDVGAIATIIFDHPEEYIGKEIEIAGDELTMPQMADAITKALGKKSGFTEVPDSAIRAYSAEAADMYKWFIEKGYEADISSLKKIYPGLTSFEQWVAKDNFKF